jgi:eukaryotic-like serine/threonine-protein kinase
VEEDLAISNKHSWKMFRGSSMRTGISASNISRKPSLLWVTEVGPVVSSPVFGEGTIYVSTITGRIFALNPSDKKIKWHLNIGSPIVSTPLIHNQILVVANYDSWVKGTSFVGMNFLFGVDRENGKQIWKFDIPGDVFSSPCLAGGNMIIVGSISGAVFALQVNSGDLLWKFETGGQVWSSPSYNGNNIFIGSDDGFLYCLDKDGKLLWKTKLNGKVRSSSPCLSFNEENPLVFIGTYSGGMFCLNQLTGEIRWSKQIKQPVMASPSILKDKVFFATSDNKLYCLRKNNGLKIWDFETGGKIWSSPSISEYDNVLFFGSLDAHIYGINIDTGKQTWKFPTMNMIDSSAAIANNMLFMASRDGLLYVFGSEMTPAYIGYSVSC